MTIRRLLTVGVVGAALAVTAVVAVLVRGSRATTNSPSEADVAAKTREPNADLATNARAAPAHGMQQLARAVEAVAALREQVETARHDDLLRVAADKRQMDATNAAEPPAKMMPTSQAIPVDELEEADSISPVLTSSAGRPAMPRPAPEVLAGILAEIATTKEAALRSGLTATYRDMVEGLNPNEMADALDRLDAARTRARARAHQR